MDTTDERKQERPRVALARPVLRLLESGGEVLQQRFFCESVRAYSAEMSKKRMASPSAVTGASPSATRSSLAAARRVREPSR